MSRIAGWRRIKRTNCEIQVTCMISHHGCCTQEYACSRHSILVIHSCITARHCSYYPFRGNFPVSYLAVIYKKVLVFVEIQIPWCRNPRGICLSTIARKRHGAASGPGRDYACGRYFTYYILTPVTYIGIITVINRQAPRHTNLRI